MNFDEIQSGQRRDWFASAIRAALTPVSWIYGVIINKRNAAYDAGRKPVRKVGVPVVCIGNLTTGGTGKTPIVCHFAKWLRGKDVRVSIISRGYRSDESGTNDEAKELANRLPDVPHVQNPERFEAAEIAVDELETELILMDDGFQHRRFHRDLDFVVIDATRPFGFGHLLPRGTLRESIKELRRASAIILSRCDSVDSSELNAIQTMIRENCSAETPIVRSCHAASGLLSFPSDLRGMDGIKNREVLCLSAIGNPVAFERTVAEAGADVVDHFQLPDHAAYDKETIKRITDWVDQQPKQKSPEAIICTHKDLVKIQTDQLAGQPLLALQIDLSWIDDPAVLYDQIEKIMPCHG